MSVSPLQPQPFFKDKNRAFWNLQTLGWMGAFVLRGTSGLANGQPASFLIPVLISTITGYSLTLLMAVIFRFLLRQRPVVTWSVSIIVVLAAAGIGAFIDAWVFATQNRTSEVVGLQLLLGAYYLTVTLLFAWSALYYAINFYLTVEEQADQLLLLENQASSAQLAMLRYQLNPHFLINEPTALVPLEQEVETLKLYLEIEKMRFEDRLRATFDIDPLVAGAHLPSLLLQPLVENAIKYAVTPKEEGAEISVMAQPAGENVQIVVSDTGPGLNQDATRPNLSTGVGLVNIRDRLSQAFGERHSFETRSTPGGGFVVTIELPHLTANDLKEAA